MTPTRQAAQARLSASLAQAGADWQRLIEMTEVLFDGVEDGRCDEAMLVLADEAVALEVDLTGDSEATGDVMELLDPDCTWREARTLARQRSQCVDLGWWQQVDSGRWRRLDAITDEPDPCSVCGGGTLICGDCWLCTGCGHAEDCRSELTTPKDPPAPEAEDVCHCGILVADHTNADGHDPVAMDMPDA